MGMQGVQIAQRIPDHVAFTSLTSPRLLERVQEAAAPLRFRRFILLPSERVLLFDGRPVEIGSRAYDLLTILLKSRGKIVGKSEIIKYVWPSTLVEESNLRFQMASLRRVLGEDRDMIKTIPGRGYLLVSDVEARDEERPRILTAAPSLPIPEISGDQEAALDMLRNLIEQASPGAQVAVFVVQGEAGLNDTLAGLTHSLRVALRAREGREPRTDSPENHG